MKQITFTEMLIWRQVFSAQYTSDFGIRLNGQNVASDTEVQSVVLRWFLQQPASFFASGIQKPDKCLKKSDDVLKNKTLMFNILKGDINLLSVPLL